MYQEQLIAMFSKALHDEFTSAIIYLKMANSLRGVDAAPVSAELITHGKEEFNHGNMIINFCANHGVDGDLAYTVDMSKINNAPDTLVAVIKETQDLEQDAIELYNKIAKLAQANGDLETKKFAQGLMLVEQEHFDDLAKYTNQTRGFMSGLAAMPIDVTIDNDDEADIIAVPR
jgi:ferritin